MTTKTRTKEIRAKIGEMERLKKQHPENGKIWDKLIKIYKEKIKKLKRGE